MGKLVAINHLTLDGVMQAPGRPDEDERGAFAHGGWAIPDNDEVMFEAMGRAMGAGGPLLLGRRTYEDFYDFWPKQAANPYTEALNRTRKHVVSSTLREPLAWENSTLIAGDVAAAVARLKDESDGDVRVLGSGELLRSLMPHGLVDRHVLMIHPLVLGTGIRLFPADGVPMQFTLSDSVTTTKGVVIATYELRAESA
jgi:dihydrofolate reductase